MKYTFLALLAKRPAHGYELKQALETAFGPGWPRVNFGQIYTTLSRMARVGLVRSQDVPQEGRPDKRVYELTPQGRQDLQDWVEASTAGPRLKDEFFMKMVLTRLAGIADLNALIERQRRDYLQALKDLDGLMAEVQAFRGVDVLVTAGELVAVMGPSEWILWGKRPGPDCAENMRVFFQFFNLIGNLIVADNIELPALMA